jgi:hypothetical protein
MRGFGLRRRSKGLNSIRQYSNEGANVQYCKAIPVQTATPAMPCKGSPTGNPCKFEFKDEFKLHRLAHGPSSFTLTSKQEMLDYFYKMNLIRRMELAADALYKAKLIRGFCHLQIGQVALRSNLIIL